MDASSSARDRPSSSRDNDRLPSASVQAFLGGEDEIAFSICVGVAGLLRVTQLVQGGRGRGCRSVHAGVKVHEGTGKGIIGFSDDLFHLLLHSLRKVATEINQFAPDGIVGGQHGVQHLQVPPAAAGRAL